ncbi:hypothetical protein [Streptomyces sp. NBC_00096]|uniref:hypothetical protein n=1 Tax=Streptomyces sp. NBC_00096 TaxID=2975650 RepID=UPI00324D20D5
MPLPAPNVLPVRLTLTLTLSLHCFVAGSVAAPAAGLGRCVAHAGEPVPDPVRWLLCGSPAVYPLIPGAAVAASGRGTGPALLAAGPPLVLVLAAGAWAGPVAPARLVWLPALAAWWPLLTECRRRSAAAAQPSS